MDQRSQSQQYILLPPRGLTTLGPIPESRHLASFFTSMAPGMTASTTLTSTGGLAPGEDLHVLDSIHEDGAKLVEMTPDAAVQLRAQQPGIRIVPVVYFSPAVAPHKRPVAAARAATAGRTAVKLRLSVVSNKGRAPVPGATVVLFTDFNKHWGSQVITDARGEAVVSGAPVGQPIDRVYIYPMYGYWPFMKKNVTLTQGMQFTLRPIDLTYADALQHLYAGASAGDGHGVTVAVVDTGIAAHPDLVIAGGQNLVLGENPADFGDNGEGHGTHVAGIIAGQGMPPHGMRGLAPNVTLRSYRVFPQHSDKASNWSITKAIDYAVGDGCDLINLSLGDKQQDDATRAAIDDAHAKGAVVIAAAGNDDRQPVSYPAAEALCLAVSAMGRRGTFPPDSCQADTIASPFGADKANFLAAFSNVGPEIDLTGPGVGIISTFPGGYAVLNGTSMACPAVTGMAARILSSTAGVLAMPRDATRADAMAQAVLTHAQALGFGATFEGQGMLV